MLLYIHTAHNQSQVAGTAGTSAMSRFAKFATGLREFGNDINANISKALNISKVRETKETFEAASWPLLLLLLLEGFSPYSSAALATSTHQFRSLSSLVRSVYVLIRSGLLGVLLSDSAEFVNGMCLG